MKLIFLLCIFFSSNVLADEFSELKSKQRQEEQMDPFANKKAFCEVTTAKGIKLSEKWTFMTANEKNYIKNLGGIAQSGTYKVEDGKLKIVEKKSMTGSSSTDSNREFELKYKLVEKGFQYIWENKMGEKLLYECKWTLI